MNSTIQIRNALPEEFEEIGKLMVKAYSQLEGFPNEVEFPTYYKMLLNVGALTKKENTELIVAISENKVAGAVVYFSDTKNYGAHGSAKGIKNATGFRLLAVDSMERGKGIGNSLCIECINRTKNINRTKILLHTTKSMKAAWRMYEKLGFTRYADIDFMEGQMNVFGFKLDIVG